MPFDGGARWQIEIAAADRTAQAFASVDKRMRGLQASTAAMSAPLGGAGAAGVAKLGAALRALGAAYGVAATAHKVWEAGMKAADLGEQAEQIGVNTDQLQAYRFAGAQAGVQTEQMDKAIVKLAQSMGSAADGNKEMIELFQRLGVRILDAGGKLRPVADTLPEVAAGLLKVNSSTQRTADSMTLLGKGGAKMTTVLADIAGGNDKLIESARKQGAILDRDVIDAWDKTADSMVRAGAAADVTYAKIVAPIVTNGLAAVEASLKGINSQFTELSNSVALINTHRGALAQIMEIINVLSGGIGARVVGKDALTRAAEGIDKARAAAVEAEVELQRLQSQAGQTGMGYRYDSAIENQRKKAEAARSEVAAAEKVLSDFQAAQARNAGTMPPVTVTGSKGVGNPTPKGTATDPYEKAIEGAQEYIATQQAAVAAIGKSAEAAARLKHETELLNKVQGDGKTATDAQKLALADWAAKMAAADATLGRAKFMDEASTKANEFIAAQQIERDTLWMSTQAADAYRLTQQALNDAKARGIELSDQEKDKLRELAAQQAAASAKAREARELYDLAKQSFVGFVGDFRQGLMDGKNFWDAFGQAGLNALNTIANKLLEMAAQKLFESAFSGGSGGGGGGGIGGLIGNLLGTAIGSIFGGGVSPGSGTLFAKGGVLDRGRITAFAGGGIVNRPMLFPMAGGRTGLMGEAGPEGILPLHRGRDGGLGVRATGLGGIAQAQRVEIVLVDDMLDARISAGANVQIVRAAPAIERRAVNQATRLAPAVVARRPAEREGEWRV